MNAQAILLLVAATLLASSATVLTLAALRRRCAPEFTDFRETIIFAAHSDDCVITAGEYAQEVLKRERGVSITYFTCGSADPADERAATRRAEACAAWTQLGLPEQRLIFLALPESPLRGPCNQTDAQLAEARRAIAAQLAALPGPAGVIVPAAGETHVDHQTMRHEVLMACAEVARSDLQILEAPEYNPFVSAWHAPLRATCSVLRPIPMLGRLAPTRCGTGFPSGPPPHRLPADPARLDRKRRMLCAFESEGGPRLARNFGRCDQLRPLAAVAADKEDTTRGYVVTEAGRWSPTTFVLYAAVCSVLLSAGQMVAAVTIQVAGPLAARGALALVPAVAAILIWRGTPRLRLGYWLAILSGVALGSLLA